MRSLFATILFVGLHSFCFAQSYFANGDAKAIGGDCYQLTPSSTFRLGSVWYADLIDLTKDFDLEFYLEFGGSDAGADGIVFVLQTVGNKALGLAGGGLGFDGFSPSLGIEFDTWQNFDLNDPSYDHIAVFKNGKIQHGGSTDLHRAVSATPSQANIEDGKKHLVRIKWDVDFKQLTLWFDCDLRVNLNVDLQNDIFQGKSQVYWGFTAATGGAVNTQVACLRKDILVPDTIAICKGDTKLLTARKSSDNTYLWRPSTSLNDPTIRTPECSSLVPMRYTVEYSDLCGEKVLDTLDVVIDQPFVMDEGHDTLLCNGRPLTFDFRTKYDSVLWHDNSRQPFRNIRDSGEVKLRAWKGVCYDDDSFYVQTSFTPKISIDGDSVFCEDETLNLEVTIEPKGNPFEWDDGSTLDKRTFQSSSSGFIRAENKCGLSIKNYSIRQVLFDDLTILGDSILCEGSTIDLSSSINNGVKYSWTTSDTISQITISDIGTFGLQISDHHCKVSAYKSITGLPVPILDLPSDILLCENERIELNSTVRNAQVFWNGQLGLETYLLENYEGNLEVRAINHCGQDSAQIEIELVECFCQLFFPNAITVNGDGLNELFRPFVDCKKLFSYELSLYSRWGEKVFTTNDISSMETVDLQKDLMQGMYFWHVEYSGIDNGIRAYKTDTGTLHLLK